jgi:serine/threonine protein kinase
VLVVEYLAGGTLARRIARRPLSPAETIQLGIRLATALAYMHASGVLHRDLKPSNIGFTAAGVAKLLDFGLTRSVWSNDDVDDVECRDAMPSRDRTIAGTAAYLPPEATRATAAAPSFDLWALAVTLLEAVSGLNPFAPAEPRVARQLSDVELTAFCARHIGSPSMRAFFARALAPNPDRRFQTATETMAALEDLRRTER